jgi:hypothetical protein
LLELSLEVDLIFMFAITSVIIESNLSKAINQNGKMREYWSQFPILYEEEEFFMMMFFKFPSISFQQN